MILIEDANNKKNAHKNKHDFWEKEGITLIQGYRLPVGDYILMNDKVQDMFDRKAKREVPVKMMDFVGTYDRVVDTKSGMQEMYSDIIGKDHARFRDSCILAENSGIEFIVLIEEPGIKTLEDVKQWKNPRREKWFKIDALHKKGKALYVKQSKIPPASSEKLMAAMMTMAEKYKVNFEFCSPDESGRRVVELLGG